MDELRRNYVGVQTYSCGITIRYSISLGDRKGKEGERRKNARGSRGGDGKGAATPDGNHCDVEGPVFGADLCGYYLFRQVSYQRRRRQRG